MHQGIGFIQDLAVVMALAGVVTVLFHRLKQPVVLGYIAAGVIIGPYTPPFQLIHDEQTIQTLGELGVVFLMFSLGLEFSLRKLFRVGATAIVAALSEIVLMLWLGYEIGRAFGWNSMDSLFLGAILAISSTTIIVKALLRTGPEARKLRATGVRHSDRRRHSRDRDARAAVRHRADRRAERRHRARHARQTAAFHDGVARGRDTRRAARAQLCRALAQRRKCCSCRCSASASRSVCWSSSSTTALRSARS